MSDRSQKYLTFLLNDHQFAVGLENVERVIRAVAVEPLPNAPEIILGVINVGGQIVPVVDMRKRLRMAPIAISLNDHFIIARTRIRSIAMIVDRVLSVISVPDLARVPVEAVLPKVEHIKGIIKWENGMILVQDLDQFLSLEEEARLFQAMSFNSKVVA